jgi:hypothetical protein
MDCSARKGKSQVKWCGVADDMNKNEDMQMGSEDGQLDDVEKGEFFDGLRKLVNDRIGASEWAVVLSKYFHHI